MAGADPVKVLAKAEALFRCLPVNQLHDADLADNKNAPASGPTLQERTTPATMGKVTVFLSHSWSDEKDAPGAKYAAVMQWAEHHREATGEEPTLWLDKASCPARPLPPLLRARHSPLQSATTFAPIPLLPDRRASTNPISTSPSPACPSSSPAARAC